MLKDRTCASHKSAGIATVHPLTGLVTIAGAGTTTITVTKAATATHEAVTESYTLTVVAPSTDATVTSVTYTVSSGGTAAETITDVPLGTSKADFLAAIVGATGASIDGTNLQDPVVTGDTVIVTAEDGTTVVTYTVTTL